jgi:hypothetical protein
MGVCTYQFIFYNSFLHDKSESELAVNSNGCAMSKGSYFKTESTWEKNVFLSHLYNVTT